MSKMMTFKPLPILSILLLTSILALAAVDD